jgi:diadenosine tetraphosphatase ApaH/serine/threonine PP2A family protein phosphatase
MFFGHTHLQGGFLCHRNGTRRLPRPGPGADHYDLQLDPDSYYLINPGSVGQPRDNDPRAAYAIHDSEQKVVTYYRIGYDIETTQRKIVEAGLPDVLAKRLEIGA